MVTLEHKVRSNPLVSLGQNTFCPNIMHITNMFHKITKESKRNR